MLKITTPISEETIKSLKVGDSVLLSGRIVTARDAAHKLMVEEKPDVVQLLSRIQKANGHLFQQDLQLHQGKSHTKAQL